ncbi:hypothetical protein NONI108955_11125 [Nocardia ninae]|uniref:Uncharacterized protein n=1 Tax=Nocardia ninae NBRC 108245 TaxID=1210091 RepID=A0A511MP38_9NOCA|nr:hypothetical protein [Nocardia ninae]GEM41948.1 hypothetical protein NN4_64670 [Nocardia ninae NBRC 108245]
MSASFEFLTELRDMARTDWGNMDIRIASTVEDIARLDGAIDVLRLEREYTLADSVARLRVDMLRRVALFEKEQIEREQQAELASVGGVAAARKGWEALRARNPKFDGATEFPTFDSLPHPKKMEYATFAHAVLSGIYECSAANDTLTWTYRDGTSVTTTAP